MFRTWPHPQGNMDLRLDGTLWLTWKTSRLSDMWGRIYGRYSLPSEMSMSMPSDRLYASSAISSPSTSTTWISKGVDLVEYLSTHPAKDFFSKSSTLRSRVLAQSAKRTEPPHRQHSPRRVDPMPWKVPFSLQNISLFFSGLSPPLSWLQKAVAEAPPVDQLAFDTDVSHWRPKNAVRIFCTYSKDPLSSLLSFETARPFACLFGKALEPFVPLVGVGR